MRREFPCPEFDPIDAAKQTELLGATWNSVDEPARDCFCRADIREGCANRRELKPIRVEQNVGPEAVSESAYLFEIGIRSRIGQVDANESITRIHADALITAVSELLPLADLLNVDVRTADNGVENRTVVATWQRTSEKYALGAVAPRNRVAFGIRGPGEWKRQRKLAVVGNYEVPSGHVFDETVNGKDRPAVDRSATTTRIYRVCGVTKAVVKTVKLEH